MTPEWTDKEIDTLIDLCNKNKSINYIALKIPTHTKIEIRTKCRSLKLLYKREKLKWTDRELERLKEDWLDDTVSMPMLRKRFSRSDVAIRQKAQELGLGPRPHDESYLTISDITKEMKVSKDRVRGWIRKGLKTRPSKIKPYKYLIDPNDLLAFLKENQDVFDASDVSEYLFVQKPQWMKQKAAKDIQIKKTKSYRRIEYTDDELKYVIELFKRGKSNEYIAEAIGRTPYGIERILSHLGLSRNRYNQYEIDIIKENIETHTLDEIVKMLPLRKRSGVIYKCEQLGLKYHTKPPKKKG